MSTPFLGEICCFAFGFPPKGWATCDGQLLPKNQNQALFSLFGTTYGGDGILTFGLPDLRGRVPIHQGGGHTRGEQLGEATHVLGIAEMPAHTHAPLDATTSLGTTRTPTAGLRLAATSAPAYVPGPGNSPVSSIGLPGFVGSGQAHENRQPYLVLNFCVALQGIFPSLT